MKIGDKVRILADRYVKVDRTGVIVRPDTVQCSKWQHPSVRMETGRWEVMIDEEFRHVNPCINAKRRSLFLPRRDGSDRMKSQKLKTALKTAADAKAATFALKAAWDAKVAADEAWKAANRAALDATLRRLRRLMRSGRHYRRDDHYEEQVGKL